MRDRYISKMKMQKLQTILQKFKSKRKVTELQLEQVQAELAFLKLKLNSVFFNDTLNYMPFDGLPCI
jgi:hypothetical protein